MDTTKILYLVNGATGHVGGQVAERLLGQGKRVRVMSRFPERIESFEKGGAETVRGSLSDPGAVREAFSGVTASLVILPLDYAAVDPMSFMSRVVDNYINAIEDNHISHVVGISSLGADQPEGTGVILGLRHLEQRLMDLPGVNVMSYRCAFFMENSFYSIDTIRNSNAVMDSTRPDLAFPQIATRDIAEVVSQRLSKLDFEGKTERELLGQRDLTMEEMTRVLGSAIGHPDLRYVQVGYDQIEREMIKMGASNAVARLMMEMSKATNNGLIRSLEGRTSDNTTSTAIEQFAQEVFAGLFQQSVRRAA